MRACCIPMCAFALLHHDGINDCGSLSRSSVAFYRLPACHALLSLVLTWALVHTLASMCDSDQKFLCP